MSETEDRADRWINRGRLAMALVSARALGCPANTCRRSRLCHARFGRAGDNFHQPSGPCPIMSDADWRAISLGLQFTGVRLKPWFEARAAARETVEPLTWEERMRRYHAPEEVEKRAAAARRRLTHPGYPCAELVWHEGRSEGIAVPADIAAAGKRIVARQAARGCACALEGRMGDDCEDACVSSEERRWIFSLAEPPAGAAGISPAPSPRPSPP